jgi:hypothetical protein
MLLSADAVLNNEVTMKEHDSAKTGAVEEATKTRRLYTGVKIQESTMPFDNESDYPADTDETERVVRSVNGIRNMPIPVQRSTRRRSTIRMR